MTIKISKYASHSSYSYKADILSLHVYMYPHLLIYVWVHQPSKYMRSHAVNAKIMRLNHLFCIFFKLNSSSFVFHQIGVIIMAKLMKVYIYYIIAIMPKVHFQKDIHSSCLKVQFKM